MQKETIIKEIIEIINLYKKQGINVQLSIDKITGKHMRYGINSKYVKITQTKDKFKLSTGEEVLTAEVHFFIETASYQRSKSGIFKLESKFMAKDKDSTFFPKTWSIKKIEQKIKEALDNIIDIDGNKYIGKTKDGVYIDMYVNQTTKEIDTAYIIKRKKLKK